MNGVMKEFASEIAHTIRALQMNALMNELIIDALVAHASNRDAVLTSIETSLSTLDRNGSTQGNTDANVIAALTKWLAGKRSDHPQD